jgi:hypothetical protein
MGFTEGFSVVMEKFGTGWPGWSAKNVDVHMGFTEYTAFA